MVSMFVALNLFVGIYATATASPIILENHPAYDLSGHMECAVDSTGAETLADMLSLRSATRFVPLEGNLNKGNSRDVFWLRFTLIRKKQFPAQSWLRLSPPYIGNVNIYIPTGPNSSEVSGYRLVKMGQNIAVSDRPFFHPEIVLPLTLPQEQPITLYLRIQSHHTVILKGAVHRPDDFLAYTYRSLMTSSVLLIIAFVIMVINLFVFIRNGDRLYLWFSLFIITSILNYCVKSGVLFVVFPETSSDVADYFFGIGISGNLLMLPLFARRLFVIDGKPWVLGYLRLMVIMAVMNMLLIPFGIYREVSMIMHVALMGLVLLIVWIAYLATQKKVPGARSYFVIFLMISPAYFLQLLRFFGFMPFEWWNTGALQVFALFNIALMTYLLSKQRHFAKRIIHEQTKLFDQEESRKIRDLNRELLESKEQLEIVLATKLLAIERQQRILHTMSHDFRTPLAVVLGNLSIMEMEDSEMGALHQTEVDKMRRAVSRLLEIMDLSLEQSRLVTPQEKFCFVLFSASLFMESQLNEVRAIWPRRTFVYKEGNGLGEIFGDAGYLRILMLNIVDNACKYSPEGSLIDIESFCGTDNKEVIIRVVNQGSISEPDQCFLLFEKYQRGLNSSKVEGSGLGLWLVKKIVEHHHGRVTMECKDAVVQVTVYLSSNGVPGEDQQPDILCS
jgi:signal transduction histidine kinase